MSLITLLEARTAAMTAPEVAEVLNISSKTIYRMHQDNSLMGFRTRGGLRFLPEKVAEYVKKQMPQPEGRGL